MSALIATLRDDMEDNAEAAAWGQSYVIGSATKAETGGRAVFTLPASTAGTHEAAYKTSVAYDLTGDGCYININQMVSTAVAAYAFFQLWLSTGNYVRWFQQSNTIKAQKVLAGVVTDLYSATWSGTTYKYLRIRESAGTTYFDSSTNGTAWTNRASLANPFAVTDLFVWIAAGVVGSVASPGAFRVEDVNLILPALTTTWRWTQIVWPLANRYKVVTLALDTVATAQGYVVTADGVDVNGDPSGNVRYWSGAASGGRELTEQASDAAAKAMAVNIPVDGRFDLPTIIEARVIRVYHRSVDGNTYILREIYPRRLVQADDIEAEAIKALHIATLDLDAQHNITAANGEILIDDQGISVVTPENTPADQDSYKFIKSDLTVLGGIYGYYSVGGAYHYIIAKSTSVTGEDSHFDVQAIAPSGQVAEVSFLAQRGGSTDVTIDILNTTSRQIAMSADSVYIDGGLNVGTATGAATGDVKASGVIQPGNVAVSYTAIYNASLANNGVMALGMSNFGSAHIYAGGAAAIYAIHGTAHSTTEMSDPAAIFTATAGSASSINVYWSAGNSRYEIENKRGSAIGVRAWLFDSV